MAAEVLPAPLSVLLLLAPELVGFGFAMAWAARIAGVVFVPAASSVPGSRDVHLIAIAERDHDKPAARPAPRTCGPDEGLPNAPGRSASTRMEL